MDIEVLPVTPDEVVRILGSLDINEIEPFLEEIKILRENRLLDDAINSATERKLVETSLIASN